MEWRDESKQKWFSVKMMRMRKYFNLHPGKACVLSCETGHEQKNGTSVTWQFFLPIWVSQICLGQGVFLHCTSLVPDTSLDVLSTSKEHTATSIGSKLPSSTTVCVLVFLFSIRILTIWTGPHLHPCINMKYNVLIIVKLLITWKCGIFYDHILK